MKIKSMLDKVNENSLPLDEKINVDTVQKEVTAIITALNGADKGLYNIATLLQQNDKYEIRKDIIAFIASINDMYEYLVVELMTKVNPPVEETPEEK